jgi:hypothetical protein
MSQCLQVEVNEKDHQKANGSQATCQMHGNLEQNEVPAFIKCKQALEARGSKTIH